MPHPACSSSLAQRRGHRLLRCDQVIGQGSDDARRLRRGSARHRPILHRAYRDTDLTLVDLGSYSSRVLMGNAAIQALSAPDLLAGAVRKLSIPTDLPCLADRRVRPRTRTPAQLLPRWHHLGGDVRHDRIDRPYAARSASPRRRRRPFPTPFTRRHRRGRRRSVLRLIPCRACGSRTIAAALNPTLVRGRSRAASTWRSAGADGGADAGAAAEAVARARTSSRRCSVEFDDARHAEVFTELVDTLIRAARSARGRSGAAAAGDAGGRQRCLRRDRCPIDEGADRRRDPEGARGRGKDLATVRLASRRPVSRRSMPPPWEGGDGRGKIPRTRIALELTAVARRLPPSGCCRDALPPHHTTRRAPCARPRNCSPRQAARCSSRAGPICCRT